MKATENIHRPLVCAAIFLEQELSIDMISQDSIESGVGGGLTVFSMFSQGPSESTVH